MRLQRGVPVGNVDAELARAVARTCHHRWSSAGDVAYRAKITPEEAARTLRQLEEAGFLERRDALHPLDAGTDEWTTTLAGGALTMASFLKPISRTRAEALLQGVLDRAAVYNVDVVKPFVITRLIVFGSYLHDDVAELGDLDLGVRLAERRPDSASAEAQLAYARQSGRRFANFVDTIGWAQNELLQLLRNRSPYINVHTEDVSKITDRWEIVYSHEPGAA